MMMMIMLLLMMMMNVMTDICTVIDPSDVTVNCAPRRGVTTQVNMV